MEGRGQIALTIAGIILIIGIMFCPDWNNIGRDVIGAVSTPLPEFEGICLGDSISKASKILDDKYDVSCADEFVTIEGGVKYCGVEFYSVELSFYDGALTEMTFEDVGRGWDQKKVFMSAQSALITEFSDYAKGNKHIISRNADNFVYYDHCSNDSLKRYYDHLSIDLQYSHFPRKYDKRNFKERQYGVVTVHVERKQYNLNAD